MVNGTAKFGNFFDHTTAQEAVLRRGCQKNGFDIR